MTTISLCMIVKNEEEVLANCLQSIQKICDEIIIVDTGSTDRTKEIAKQFTDKVLDFKWIDDFSAARNFAFSQATMDYILWLDADDVLLPNEQEKFHKLKATLDGTVDAVSMIYVIDRDEYGNPSFHYRRNRLVKRSKNFKWIGPVHEYLEVGGHILSSDIAVEHKKHIKKASTQISDRNLRIYENRIKNGEDFSPRDLFYFANELRDHQQYEKAIIYYNEFLRGKKGWIEDNIRACLYLADIHARRGEKEEEMDALLKTLAYDVPRPETSCRIGDYFKARKLFRTAVFWYDIAYQKKKITSGFQNESYSTWYPHLALCVCHWELGNVEKSIEHNKMAKKYRPNDKQVLFNEKFFNDYLKNKNGKK
ncbi:glycosyltransferase involved in cell wall biosynthesis [Bacillus sp. SORGH_AS 510]|uniref:tetratricopeptide repeat-containing glycosyltransferase family 2 protein n=1 Tax=Bacillus sp. SORGH_AS_0510 TaxID=3041771 RepID=UPI00277ECC4C|nr:glycosyltransferase [Bacillus sp. SORGH_AS_0510]MDQ1147984.1 glycosyltransferase involved in cell wall biosynthesis [Bacillus sp. SORGH_AS_0510]